MAGFPSTVYPVLNSLSQYGIARMPPIVPVSYPVDPDQSRYAVWFSYRHCLTEQHATKGNEESDHDRRPCCAGRARRGLDNERHVECALGDASVGQTMDPGYVTVEAALAQQRQMTLEGTPRTYTARTTDTNVRGPICGAPLMQPSASLQDAVAPGHASCTICSGRDMPCQITSSEAPWVTLRSRTSPSLVLARARYVSSMRLHIEFGDPGRRWRDFREAA